MHGAYGAFVVNAVRSHNNAFFFRFLFLCVFHNFEALYSLARTIHDIEGYRPRQRRPKHSVGPCDMRETVTFICIYHMTDARLREQPTGTVADQRVISPLLSSHLLQDVNTTSDSILHLCIFNHRTVRMLISPV